MIKFLHCADLHLDSPMAALDLHRAAVRRAELRASFTSLTMSAKMNAADFLLICGDLFDSTRVSRETVELLRREFAQLSDTAVIIAPGNHDPYTHASYYRRTKFSDNVYIFDSPELSYFDFPEKNTTVYGWAFCEAHQNAPQLDQFSVENPARINLLAAHADLDAAADSPYCAISSKTLAACGFDYAALGHQHSYEGIKPLGQGYVVYSGCLEGRGFDELGPKGAVLGAAEKEDKLQFAAKLVRYGKRHYEVETVDITGALSHAEILERISAMLAQKHYGEDTALRVRLTGKISGECRLALPFLTEQFPQLFLLELIDETQSPTSGDKLSDDPTLRGAFYRSLTEQLQSPDAAVRETATLALRYGLAALDGEEILD